jgi:hypothetical protein
MANNLGTLHIATTGCTLQMPLRDFLNAYWTVPVTVVNEEMIEDNDAIRRALLRLYRRALTPGTSGDALLLRWECQVGGDFFAQVIQPSIGGVAPPNLDNAVTRNLHIDGFYTLEDPENILFFKDDGTNFYIDRATLVKFITPFAS